MLAVLEKIQERLGPGKLGHIVALIAGCLLPFSVEPHGIWPLAIISPTILLATLCGLSPRQAFVRGWFYGVGMFGVGVSWVYVSISEHSNTPIAIALIGTAGFCCFLALFTAFQTWLFSKLLGRLPRTLTMLTMAFVSTWVLMEWVRSWALTGFPWLYLGEAHIDSWLSGWFPIVGVFGVSMINLLIAVMLHQFLFKFEELRWIKLELMVIPFLAGAILTSIEWVDPLLPDPIKVTAVQGNIDQDTKWLPEQLYPTLAKYRNLTTPNWESDLILWPETAITMMYDKAQNYLDFLGQQASENNAVLISGIPYQYPYDHENGGRYHNSVVAVGNGFGLYHKQKLVPFGEYVPMEAWLRGLIDFFNLPMSAFIKGPEDQDLLLANIQNQDLQIAPFICYEIAYPSLVASMARDSAIMITISNDAWFGLSWGPEQHLGLARVRAAETQRYLLRSTNTGITALIDDEGRVIERLPQNTADYLTGDAILKTGQTPYMVWLNWPILFIILGMFSSLGYFRIKQNKLRALAAQATESLKVKGSSEDSKSSEK